MYTWKQLMNKEMQSVLDAKFLKGGNHGFRVQRGGRTMPASRVGERKLGLEGEFGQADEGHFNGQNMHTPSQKVEVEAQVKEYRPDD